MTAVASATATLPDLQPTLVGKRLLLRPLLPDDWAQLYAAAADPLIWADHPDCNRWREPVFRDFFETALAWRSAFAVVERASERIIGSSRYRLSNSEVDTVEIGWTFLVRDVWRDGSNRELKALMLGHAFTFAETVIFVVGADNERSKRAVVGIGARQRPGAIVREMNGVEREYVVFEIKHPVA